MRIQDLCKGGPSEILPTSCSGVAVAAKIWASKLGVGGGAGSLGPPRSAPGSSGAIMGFWDRVMMCS